jgi:hypothetical protein
MNSLKQGILFKNVNNNIHKVINTNKLDIIQNTSMSNLGSFYEGMTNKEIDNKNDKMTEELMTLQDEFNNKLQEYENTYKKYLTMLKHNMDIINSYSNMNVKDQAGNKYFINKYGYARLYSNEGWNKKHSSCPVNMPDDKTVEIFNKLQIGEPLGVGQPCNLEGNIILSNDNQNKELKAWVAPNGLKHKLTGNNSSCINKNKIDVLNTTYDKIPSGSDYNVNSKCSTTQNEDLWNKIVSLNNELITIAGGLFNKTEELEQLDNVVDESIINTKNTLKKRANILNKERDELLKIQSEHRSLMGRFQDNNINLQSDYYNYLAWTIGAVTFGAIAYYKLIKK